MFTGLVQALATVVALASDRLPGKRLVVAAPQFAASAKIGESIAVSGCCLTLVAAAGGNLEFDVGPETLEKTNLGELIAGSRVNLERSLAVGDLLGGHLVTGHIDTTAALVTRRDDRDWSIFKFQVEPRWMQQIAPKGSVALDGVSLTVVEVEPDGFSVALIPHTLALTTLGQLAVGGRVNLETDLVAKYVERQMGAGT